MKILIVEDEKKTATYLRRGLTENGFTVEVAVQGEDGLRLAKAGDHELIILDVMLPERDGWSILAELRGAGKQTPVLILTARDAIRDRVKGLKLGADDYLVKPFAFAELLARVQSILRRTVARPGETVRVGDLEIDLLQHRATRAGQRLDLTPKEFKLLALLAGRTGQVLPRSLIARQVWEMACEGDTNVVEVNVRRLRAKVDDPFEKKLIHTVRGLGYVLEERA
jgi:two-component system copper resistance phosphate regulon response regulator CusR